MQRTDVKCVCSITGDIDSGEPENKKILKAYFSILERYDIKMTVPVTAVAAEAYPERIKFIIENGHEITGHGDIHKEFYGSVSEQAVRLRKMIDKIYDITGVHIQGFRAPWLKHNSNTYNALSQVGLRYDSSQLRGELISRLPLVDTSPYRFKYFKKMKFMLHIIARMLFHSIPARPLSVAKGVLELPITKPDDYYLIDSPYGQKYRPEESKKIGEIWVDVLKYMTQRNRELFIIQAHPGRMSPDYLEGLDFFLKTATKNKKCGF